MNANGKINILVIAVIFVVGVVSGSVFFQPEISGAINSQSIVQVNVKDFGAIGNGINDDTAAIQSAIDSLGTQGGSVFVPKGVYICNNIKLKSNITFEGEGWETILQQKEGLTGYQSLVGINQGNLATNYPEGNTTLEGTVQNVVVKNMKLRGTVEKEGFKEWINLMSLSSCSKVLVDTVCFEGFRGDGLFLGVEAWTERHVSNIVIRNSTFDGVNKNNRNGIGIIDGFNILIDNNFFTRVTRQDMPGAISIEPNTNQSAKWSIIKHINIRNNHFKDVGRIAIQFNNSNLQGTMKPRAIDNIVINGNTIEGAYVGIYLLQKYAVLDEKVDPLNIHVLNNTITNCYAPLQAQGTKTVTIIGNNFEQCDNGIQLGVNNKKVMDFLIDGNTFKNLGYNAGESGIHISDVSNATISNNSFIDCGVKTLTYKAGYAVVFYGGKSDNIKVFNNTVSSPNGITTYFLFVAKNHKTNPYTNMATNNVTNGLKTYSIVK